MSGKPEDAAKRDVAALAAELAEQLASLAAFSGSGLAPTNAPAVHSGRSPGVPSYAGPRTMLENAGRFVAPVLPAGAPLRPLKAVLLRVLRIVTRDQTTFNSALLESLRGALLESEARESAGQDLLASQRRLDAIEKDRDERVEALARRQEREEAGKRLLAEKIESATEGLRALRLEWSSLRSSLRDLSGALPRPSGDAADGIRSAAVRADDPMRAGLYVDFEEHFRGTEEDIRGRQASDAARFRGAPGPVADLGCGRGEFLEALAAEGVAAIGCDANPVMAARAKEKRLAVDRAD